MRKIFYIMALAGGAFLSAFPSYSQQSASAPETLSEGMATILTAVKAQRAGMEDKDKHSLMDAAELYAKVPTADLKFEVTSLSADDALGTPEVYFTPQYCDAVIASDFQPFDLADITDSYMRPADAVPVFHSRLGGGAEATFSIRARKGCQLLVVSPSGEPLKVSLSAGGKDIEDMKQLVEDNGTTNIVLWRQPSGSNKVDITITNPGDKAADFMMAVN